MSGKTAKTIRRALNLGRIPKQLPAHDRAYYRGIKRRYIAQPSSRKAEYLDCAIRIAAQIKAEMARALGRS